jgi:hypothetical protein
MEKLAAELHVAKPKGCCTDLPVESITRPVSALGDPRAQLQRGLEPLRCSPQRRPEQDHQHESFHHADFMQELHPSVGRLRDRLARSSHPAARNIFRALNPVVSEEQSTACRCDGMETKPGTAAL